MSPTSKVSPRERITRVVEGWFLTEPLLFAAWTLHEVVEQPAIESIRVGRGRIEFNPQFIAGLRKEDLRSVLSFEAMRILLGHPYARRQSNAELSYTASNVTVQECLRTRLPMPRASELFGDESFDDQYFEFYYRELSERSHDEPSQDEPPADRGPDENESEDEAGEGSEEQGSDVESEEASEEAEGGPQSSPCNTSGYSDASQVGLQNTANWDADDLLARRNQRSAARSR